MSRRALIVSAACGAAVLVLLGGTAFGWWHGRSSGGAELPEPLAVQTALTPNPAAFADPVQARVTVAYDARTVDGSAIRLDTSFAPYAETAAPDVTRTRAGDTGILVYTYYLQCLADDCLPVNGKPRTLRFPRAIVSATSGSGTLRASDRWPPLVVTSRLAPGQIGGSAHFRRPSTLRPPVYTVSPSLLSGGLVAAAVLLAAGALALLMVELLRAARHRRERRARRQSRRELALAYAREASTRDAADRRKALDLLAATLADEGEPALAALAVDAAWAEAPPTADRTLQLVHQVEHSGLEHV